MSTTPETDSTARMGDTASTEAQIVTQITQPDDEQQGGDETAAPTTVAEGSPTAERAEDPQEAPVATARTAATDDESRRDQDEQEDLVREGEVAADFLESLLDIADLDGDLEVDVEGARAAVAIVDSEDGAAPRRLVGPGGSVLEALQELTRLAVQAETGERSRLMLDVAGYRADRRGALVRQAQMAIAEVKESGDRRELEPMTAFERKVVHDEVLAAGLSSESEGVEPSRYVVILPEG